LKQPVSPGAYSGPTRANGGKWLIVTSHGWLRRIAHNEAAPVVGRRPKEVLAAEPIPYESGSGTDDEVDDRLVLSDAVAKLSEATRSSFG